MQCNANAALYLVAGFLAAAVVGFVFRATDAERRQSLGEAHASWFMSALAAPFWSLPGMLLFVIACAFFVGVLMLRDHLFGPNTACGAEFGLSKIVLVSGMLFGWFLRHLFWRVYLGKREGGA